MRPFAFLLSLLLLTGCGYNVHRLNELNPPANDFPTALASEYQAYAESEAEQGRSAAAEHYAGKGLKALKGEAVEPEPIDSDLSAKNQKQLAEMRVRLIKFLNDDMKHIAPQKLARAQLLFDCWQHQLGKELNQEHAPCGDEFRSTLSDLQDISDSLHYSEQTVFTITFNDESSALDEQANATAKDIAKAAHDAKQYSIVLQGFSGKLADARIAGVRHALIKAGIHSTRIHIRKQGGSKAVVLSDDKTPAVNPGAVVITLKTRSPGA